MHLNMNQMLENVMLAQINFCKLSLLFEGDFQVKHKDVPLVQVGNNLVLQKKKTVEFTAYMVRTVNLEGRTSCRNVDNLLGL